MTKRLSSTHDRILERGTDLLSASGFAGITLGALAEQTCMSKSGLFAHFRSKEEVQLQLLENTTKLAAEHVVAPAMRVEEGLPRLKALVKNWLGWSTRAGLSGGCAVAAGLFELDDGEGPVRDQLLKLEKSWRDLLAREVKRAIDQKQLRKSLDVGQFVWELCGIYLSHHASYRFVRDKSAGRYARVAFDALIARALPEAKD